MTLRRRLNLPPDWQELVSAAKKAGWKLAKGRGGHVKWTAPDGTVITTGSTPSDRRAFYNARANLRRKGLAV